VSGRFAKGYRRNVGVHPSGHALLAAHKLKALPPLTSPDLRPFNGPILNQGNLGSCVAFAGARQLALFLKANDLTTEWILPSPLWGYAIGRLQEYAGTDPDLLPATALDDVGTMPAHYLLALQRLGFVRWADWAYPTDTATLDDGAAMLALCHKQPPAEVVLKAYAQKELEYGLFEGAPSERMAWIIDCLRHRLPMTFGHEVDDAYEANSGQVVQSIDVANSLGGHDECIVAVNKAGNVIVAGSWTADFGAGGYTEWSPAAIESDACSDFQVMRGATVPEAT
jgi:hypothetical protein